MNFEFDYLLGTYVIVRKRNYNIQTSRRVDKRYKICQLYHSLLLLSKAQSFNFLSYNIVMNLHTYNSHYLLYHLFTILFILLLSFLLM